MKRRTDLKPIVPRPEDIESGAIIKRNRYDSGESLVKPEPQAEILPPVRTIPQVVDPYTGVMPQTVQNIVRYEATPITRAKAMTMKVHQVTLFLAILTGALMLVLQWYPADWTGLAVFFLWLALASVEWIAVFCLLAILDYRETPAAQNRTQMKAYIGMMQTEQYHRLRAMYPDQFKDEGK